MEGNIAYRLGTIEDISSIQAIYNYYIDHTNDIYDKKHRDETYMQDWWNSKLEKGFPVFVAEIDQKVVGFSAYGNFRRWDAYECTVEHTIYIAKEHIHKGIGDRLLELLMDEAKRKGFHSMIGGMDGKNKGSIDFHARRGFKEVARIPEVAYKNGERLELVLMQKMLT